MTHRESADEGKGQGRRYRSIAVFAALAGLIIAAYWRVLHFPFIQDDWGWMYRFRTESPASLFKSFFNPTGVLFFRPLAQSYLYAIYRIFGVNPIPFHVMALCLHFANSCLVIAIMRRVTRDEIMPYAVGFVYAVAVAIVLDPLLWAVGIFDLGASCLFLLSIYLFMKERPVASAVVFFAGCLFKETVIVLPIILFIYALMMWTSGRTTLRALLGRRLAPIAIALCVVVIIKLMGKRPDELVVSDPYYVHFLGIDSVYLLSNYMGGLFQSIVPFGNVKGESLKVVRVFLLFLFVASIWLATRARRRKAPADGDLAREFLILNAWFWTAVLPLLLMPNHVYRYYMMCALPAFIALMFVQVRLVASAMHLGRRVERALVIGIAAFAVISSGIQAQRVLDAGMGMHSLIDGSNGLVRKATLVTIVHDGLMKYAPKLPSGAVIVLGNVDVWAFNKDSGPRIWYGDETLSVYPMESLIVDSTGAYVNEGFQNQRQRYTGEVGKKRPVDLTTFFGFGLDSDLRFRPARFKGVSGRAVGGA